MRTSKALLKRKEVVQIIKPFDNWANDSGDSKNTEARQALYVFYFKLKEIAPETSYYAKAWGHTSYLQWMIKIKMALDARKYERACHEIVSLDRYDLLYQGRSYYNLLDCLQKALNIEAPKNKGQKRFFEETGICESYEYNKIMGLLAEHLPEKKVEEQKMLLTYVADALRKDLQGDQLTKAVDQYCGRGFKLVDLFPTHYQDKSGQEQQLFAEKGTLAKKAVDLTKNGVVLLPWQLGRWGKHRACYFKGLDICYAYSGKYLHHLERRQGKIMADVIDITPLFACVDTNGEYWTLRQEWQRPIQKVMDFRLAALYQVAMMLEALKQEKI